MSRKRLNFLKGFAVGVALIAVSKLDVIVAGKVPLASNLASNMGLWIDWAAQALLIGLIGGAIGVWIGARARRQP